MILAGVVRTSSGQIVVRPKPSVDLALQAFAERKRLADGSFLLAFPGEQITLAEAAAIPDVNDRTMLRFEDFVGPDQRPLLEFERVSPKKIRVSLASVLRLKQRRRELLEFWETCREVVRDQ